MTWTAETKAEYFRNHPEGRKLLSGWHRKRQDLEVLVYYFFPEAKRVVAPKWAAWHEKVRAPTGKPFVGKGGMY